jgi:hypothetical protein
MVFEVVEMARTPKTVTNDALKSHLRVIQQASLESSAEIVREVFPYISAHNARYGFI